MLIIGIAALSRTAVCRWGSATGKASITTNTASGWISSLPATSSPRSLPMPRRLSPARVPPMQNSATGAEVEASMPTARPMGAGIATPLAAHAAPAARLSRKGFLTSRATMLESSTRKGWRPLAAASPST